MEGRRRARTFKEKDHVVNTFLFQCQGRKVCRVKLWCLNPSRSTALDCHVISELGRPACKTLFAPSSSIDSSTRGVL